MEIYIHHTCGFCFWCSYCVSILFFFLSSLLSSLCVMFLDQFLSPFVMACWASISNHTWRWFAIYPILVFCSHPPNPKTNLIEESETGREDGAWWRYMHRSPPSPTKTKWSKSVSKRDITSFVKSPEKNKNKRFTCVCVCEQSLHRQWDLAVMRSSSTSSSLSSSL